MRSVLRRFDPRFFRNLSASDLTQVPARDSLVDLYRQGATTSEAKTVGTTEVAVNVYDPGDLREGDVVTVGIGGPDLTVVGAPSATQVQLIKAGTGTVSVPLGARLMPKDRRPTVDGTPLGHGGPFQVSVDAAGFPVLPAPPGGVAQPGYITYPHYAGANAGGAGPPRLDYVLSSGGLATPRLYRDVLAGINPSPAWLNARDFGGDLYAALDATPEGGVLYLPGGVYDVEKREDGGLRIVKHGITLIGDGPLATKIRAKAPVPGMNPDFDLLTIEAKKLNCQLRGIQFDGMSAWLDPPGSPQRSCIVLDGQIGNNEVQGCLFEDLIVKNASSYGLLLKLAVDFRAFNCVFEGNRRAGARAQDFGTTTRFFRCGFTGNGGTGIPLGAGGGMQVDDAQASLIACAFENNVGGEGVPDRGTALDIRTESLRVEVLGCYFASSAPSHPFDQFIYCQGGPAAIVSGCWFDGCKLTGQGPRVKRAARFVNSWGARFSSNVAIHLDDGGTMVQFDGVPPLSDAIEFGNREWGNENNPIEPPRITISDSLRVFSLSRGVVQLVRYDDEFSLPNLTTSPGNRIPLGSMVWVDSVQGGLSKLWVVGPTPSPTWLRLEVQ